MRISIETSKSVPLPRRLSRFSTRASIQVNEREARTHAPFCFQQEAHCSQIGCGPRSSARIRECGARRLSTTLEREGRVEGPRHRLLKALPRPAASALEHCFLRHGNLVPYVSLTLTVDRSDPPFATKVVPTNAENQATSRVGVVGDLLNRGGNVSSHEAASYSLLYTVKPLRTLKRATWNDAASIPSRHGHFDYTGTDKASTGWSKDFPVESQACGSRRRQRSYALV